MPVKQAKMAKKTKKMSAKPVKKPVTMEESDDGDSDSSEEVPPQKKTRATAKPVKKPVKKAESEDSGSESEDESEEEQKPKKASKAKAKPAKAPAKKESSDEGESEEGSSDEEMAPVKPVAANTKKAKAAKESDEDDSEEEDEESEEEPPKPVKKSAKKPAKKEESSEEDSDEEDSDEEDNEKASKGKPGKAPLAKMEVEDDDDESDEEDDEEGSEDDESEEEPASKKRKAKDSAGSPTKKAKTTETITIMVKNLPEEASDEKVVKFLKKNGVETTDFRRNVKKGYGFLDLADADALSAALELSGTEFKGSELTIEKAEPKGQKNDNATPQRGGQTQGGSGGESTLFVKNISYNIDEEQLLKFFDGAKDIRMPTNEEGRKKGFAFVEFSSAKDAETAMSEKQGADLDGRALFLDYSGGGAKGGNRTSFGSGGGDRRQSSGGNQSRGDLSGKTKLLFVKNLSFQTTRDSLQEAFESHSATSARVAMKDDGQSKGFGFIEFGSSDDAKAAHDSMQGADVDGRSIFVDFATESGSGGGGRGGSRGGGFRGGRGFDRGGRGGGFRGGRGGDRGGGGFRGSRGGDRGRGRGGFGEKRDGIKEFRGSKKTFDD